MGVDNFSFPLSSVARVCNYRPWRAHLACVRCGVVPMSGGRPRLEIDWTEFDRLCAVQCILAELAAFFGV